VSSAKQNFSIARLIVGAMCIDGSLDREERKRVSQILEELGMGELIADVGIALDEDEGDFNLFSECDELLASLGSIAPEVSPLIFRNVADVVACDRFVSAQEATYLSALARRLGLQAQIARAIFKQVLADRNARIEISGKQIDEQINPYMKELLSFSGADFLVGKDYSSPPSSQLTPDAPQSEEEVISPEDLSRAFAVLGLESDASMSEAEAVWRQTIQHLDLPKMAELGETFVSAAINRITRINEAYKIVLRSGRN